MTLRLHPFLTALRGGLAALMVVCSLASAAHAQLSLPNSSRDVFPSLPPSSRCTKDLLAGTWKLLALYEVPAGREMQLYIKRPLQFNVFSHDGLYSSYISSWRDIPYQNVKREAFAQKGGPQQFVVKDSGIIFFYKDGIAIDSLACFIVAQNDGPFELGQMLLMPPEQAARGRLVKIYQKVWIDTGTNQ
jgi:hypothetical protein